MIKVFEDWFDPTYTEMDRTNKLHLAFLDVMAVCKKHNVFLSSRDQGDTVTIVLNARDQDTEADIEQKYPNEVGILYRHHLSSMV